MRPLGTRIIFELVLGMVVAVSLVVMLRQSRRIAESQRRLDANAQSLRLLQEALRQQNAQKAPPAVPEEAPAATDRAGIAKREATITRLDRDLAQARSTIADLQMQLSASHDQNAKTVASSEQQLQKQQADAQSQIAGLQQKLDAALTDASIARQRLAAVEADNGKLKTDATATTTRAADVTHIIDGLQDLERRRDVYLTSILRRYRDITGEFRAMGGMLDTSHDPSAGACGGANLSRIQNAVNSAEDDLRQVSELNARAQKLEKQLNQQ